MALVMVSGLACSGRTRRSEELRYYFEEQCKGEHSNMRVIRLSDKDVNIRHDQYSSQKLEKPARAAYLSLIMRNLSKNTIVIADGGAGTNIKGFRYQLWCAARETGIRSASVLCVARPEICKQRNSRRLGDADVMGIEQNAYDESALEELLMRFEEPNAMTRWDSPLFVLDCNPKGDNEEAEEWEKAPVETIWEAITSGKMTKAPDVVAPIRATTGNYLSILESSSQLVLSAFQELVSFGTLPDGGGEIRLSLSFPTDATSKTVQVPLTLPVGQKAPTTAALQRYRRQFVKMHASGAAAGNELGHALRQEGRTSSFASHGSSRAERKGQQHTSLATNSNGDNSVKSMEEDIARRFIAYLEESL